MDSKKQMGQHCLVHLDLKRAPIKVDYFEKVFPFLHDWGATGLLIEWEDTFPYKENLESIGSCSTESKAYSESDVEQILKLAEESDLSVIPLVQTFGHLEFVLRHEEWKELREVWRFTNALCPSNPKSLSLITTMIDQVISKMPQSLKYFHIGADEVWQLGSCNYCSSQDKHVILLDHLTGVLRHFKEKYPQIRPIMWDDMLRTVPSSLIIANGLAELTDIMVWFYEPSPFFNIQEDLWNKYTSVFSNRIWVASAYKGATGACQILPIINHHVSNHEQWIAQIQKSQTEIQGIALTGWSRYDHFATLCELLPTALPCLAICLSVWGAGSYSQGIHKKVSVALGYAQVPLLNNPYPRPQAVSPELNFPGWKIATGVEWLANLKGKHMAIINSDQIGAWMNSWQLSSGFVSPMQIQGIVSALFHCLPEENKPKFLMFHFLTAGGGFVTVTSRWLKRDLQTPRVTEDDVLASKGLSITLNKINPSGVRPLYFVNPISGISFLGFSLREEWEGLEKYMKEQLNETYYPPQIEEWLATHCRPLKEKVLELYRTGHDCIADLISTESLKVAPTFLPTPRPI